MAEFSGLWTTGGATGDQQASYTQAQLAIMTSIMSACSGYYGVAPGYGAGLACTYISANHCHVDTGGAIVDGKYYNNDAPGLGVTIDSATAGHYRIDRIVVLCDNVAMTVRIAVKKNTVEDAPAPALTLTEDWTVPGAHFACMLYQASVTDAGVVTLTDERVWAQEIDYVTLTTSTMGILEIKDGGITATKIANRTRKFILEGVGVTSGAHVIRNSLLGLQLDNDLLSTVFATFICPQDYVSDLTITPLWYSSSAMGNIYYKTEVYWAAVGEVYSTHSSLGVYAALGASNNLWQVGTAIAVASPGVSDIITINFTRDGTSGSDTSAGVMYFLGFIVSYTADS